MSTTPEALTLGGLIAMRMPRDAEECRLTIRMENPGGLTAHQTVDVVSAQFGFDWEARQLVLTPSRPMSALSAQDLEDLRKSARAGQSWHAYQQHKRHSDEKDVLRARLAAVEAERDQLRAEVAEYMAERNQARDLVGQYRAELEALRSGEFICGKCGLRKDAEQSGPAPF